MTFNLNPRRQTIASWTLLAVLLGAFTLLVTFTDAGRRFGPMGMHHILTGYDHLAFLLMLLIGTHALKALVLVATTFTVAHTITLSAAALGFIDAPANWIEPLIVVTILYVALENLVTARPRARLALTFGFGLIHGLGFAGALAEGPLPPNEELIALASFNLGVEVGQLAFLGLLYPLWRAARTSRAEPYVRRSAAVGVLLMSLYWLWERLQ